MNNLPSGHNRSYGKVEWDIPGIPEHSAVSIVMPLAYGGPSRPAMVSTCFVCGQDVWRSLNAPDMYRICWDCAEEQEPGFIDRQRRL